MSEITFENDRPNFFIASAFFCDCFYGELAALKAKEAFAGRDRRRIKREMNRARRHGWQEEGEYDFRRPCSSTAGIAN